MRWYQKGKTNLNLLEQETVSGSGISWAICKSEPCPREITKPAFHPSFFTGRMPFLLPNQQRQSSKCKMPSKCEVGLLEVGFLGKVMNVYPLVYSVLNEMWERNTNHPYSRQPLDMEYLPRSTSVKFKFNKNAEKDMLAW